jgi:SAM-dependent methyltransferase/uncharacterized protein YbaR (Trm112 family)
MNELDPWYLENLVCPVSKGPLRLEGAFLMSGNGNRYPIVEGMPVMLRDDTQATLDVARKSLDVAKTVAMGGSPSDPFYSETLGITLDERRQLLSLGNRGQKCDPVAAIMIGQASGNAYKHIKFEDLLDEPYMLPAFRFPQKTGGTILDVGCNWGRWTLSASRAGHQAVGVDPQLGAVLAARRVARQLGLSARFVVGDARYLPFREGVFDYAWSYSVIQHFSYENARLALGEARRILRSGGRLRFQMANTFGARSFYIQARRRFRPPKGFDVRYWTPQEMRKTFTSCIGFTTLEADCFFGLGLQWSDYAWMSLKGKAALLTSEGLRRLSLGVPFLFYVADSLFCTSVRD